MLSFLRGPVVRSLLIGIVALGGTVVLRCVSGAGFYDRHVAGLPGLPTNLSYDGIVLVYQMGWAWIALSIVGSYVWHTRHLDRKTVAGTGAEVLMWLLYALLLLLALLMWVFMPEPYVPGQPHFMD